MIHLGRLLLEIVAARGHAAESTGGVSSHELGEVLQSLHAAASGFWAPLALDVETFVRHLAACLSADTARPPLLPALKALHANDLYLACAAGLGHEGAVEIVVNRFIDPAVRAVKGGAGPESPEDLVHTLHERLLAAGGAPRILQYGGRAPLAGWIAVAARRAWIESLRADAARRRTTTRAAAEPLGGPSDPELDYLRAKYKDAFEAAVAASFAALPHRMRAVLRLHTIGELTLSKVGAMFGVDESTASRWVQRARATVLDETRRALVERFGVSPREVGSLVRLIDSEVEVSVARLLEEGSAST